MVVVIAEIGPGHVVRQLAARHGSRRETGVHAGPVSYTHLDVYQRQALNRMHAAAMGDTLGILFVLLGLIVIAGPGFDALKLFLVVLFFWVASPVAGHMISRLEATTDEDLGEIEVKGHEDI